MLKSKSLDFFKILIGVNYSRQARKQGLQYLPTIGINLIVKEYVFLKNVYLPKYSLNKYKSFGLPALVISPPWSKTSPLGIFIPLFSILACVSEIQTNRNFSSEIGVLGSSGVIFFTVCFAFIFDHKRVGLWVSGWTLTSVSSSAVEIVTVVTAVIRPANQVP